MATGPRKTVTRKAESPSAVSASEGVDSSAEELTPKQARFCQEYVIDLNGKQAAIRAGYSEHSAEMQASRLLSYAKVAARVGEMQAEIANRNRATANRVIQELQSIAFANHLDYVRLVEGEPAVDLSKMTREQAAAIKDITVEDYRDGRGEESRDVRRVRLSLYDKHPALVNLGKHLGMFA